MVIFLVSRRVLQLNELNKPVVAPLLQCIQMLYNDFCGIQKRTIVSYHKSWIWPHHHEYCPLFLRKLHGKKDGYSKVQTLALYFIFCPVPVVKMTILGYILNQAA